MTRRVVVGAVALTLLTSACGLGDRQANADRIINAGKHLMASSSLAADISARVNVLPVDRVLVAQEPPRIFPGTLPPVPAFINPAAGTAAVAVNAAGDAAIRFVGSSMYERIPAKRATTGAEPFIAPSNLPSILAASTGEAVGQGFVDSTTGATLLLQPSTTTSSTTTSTTAAPHLLRHTVQIVRTWVAFDFADIKDHDRTKHGGSFAISPVALLRLTTGVLTGSVKRHGNLYEANVSRDKAERKLSEGDRKVLNKMFTANAVTRRVFPATFVFDNRGALVRAEFRLRQQLSSKDRADLTIGMTLRPAAGSASPVKSPPRRGTVHASTLGQLVSTVSGA